MYCTRSSCSGLVWDIIDKYFVELGLEEMARGVGGLYLGLGD